MLSDLVEYFVVMVPDRAALGSLVPALSNLVETATIRILDLVVAERGLDGGVEIVEFGEVDSLVALQDVDGEAGSLLSDDDVRLAARALPPGAVGIIVVTEDRWAEPLSTAARHVGGQIVAGDRISSRRVEARFAEGERGER